MAAEIIKLDVKSKITHTDEREKIVALLESFTKYAKNGDFAGIAVVAIGAKTDKPENALSVATGYLCSKVGNPWALLGGVSRLAHRINVDAEEGEEETT